MNDLLEIAYALQINFSPENPDLDAIKQEIQKLRETATTKDRKAWRMEIKNERRQQRSVACHEQVTLITRKNINLMSAAQLAYLPMSIKTGTIYYPLDIVTDVDALLLLRKNPFTNEALTSEQIIFLEQVKANNKFPRIVVGDFFEEVDERLCQKTTQYQERVYESKMRQLAKMIESVNMPFEANQIFNFATEYILTHYNLFLKHQPLNQRIDPCSRDQASATTLNHIINYLNIEYQRDKTRGTVATVHMANAIDEFIYMIRNSLTYEELLRDRGLANELYWKPNFIVETYHNNGNLDCQYYVNDHNVRHGTYKVFYSNGNLSYQSTYVNGTEQDSCYYYGSGELAMKNNTYWYPNGQLMADPEGYIYKVYDHLGQVLGYGYWDTNKGFRINDIIIKITMGDQKIYGLESYKQDSKNGIFFDWSISGNLKSTKYYVDNLLTGTYEEFHPNGKLRKTGVYHNSYAIGLWSEWFSNSKLHEQGSYDDSGQKTGFWRRWHSNGQLAFEKFYDEGCGLGICQSWHENGQLATEKFYENQNSFGVEQMWYPDGTLESYKNHDTGTYYYWHENKKLGTEGFYSGKLQQGMWTSWYESGDLKSRVCYDQGKKIGFVTTWYPNGNLEKECFYEDDIIMGLFQNYHSNGNLNEHGLYLGGSKIGLWQTWSEFGKLRTRVHYDQNKFHGQYQKWHPNGSLAIDRYFSDNQKDGLYLVYHENGQLEAKGYWEQDKKIGFFLEWYANGICKSESFYDNDQVLGLYQSWNSQGVLINKGCYRNGQRHGLWYEGSNHKSGEYLNGMMTGTWNMTIDGIILRVEIYEYGMKHGINQRFYPNGVLCSSGNCTKDNPTGPWKYYYPNGQLAASGNYSYKLPSFSCWDPSGKYIGERIISRGNEVSLYTKDDNQRDGLSFTNDYITSMVYYYHNGVQQPLAKWIFENEHIKCEYFNL